MDATLAAPLHWRRRMPTPVLVHRGAADSHAGKAVAELIGHLCSMTWKLSTRPRLIMF